MAFAPAEAPLALRAAVVDGVGRVAEADARPNIVLFMTDDQNRNELRWMPKTRRLLQEHGVTFSGALSPAPACCPARAMTITGQYGQNNGVQSNTGPFGGFDSLKDKDNTLASWLQSAGYQTALVGKYLNGYGGKTRPPVAGWTLWNPSVKEIYSYFGTTFLDTTATDGTGTKTYSRNVTPVIADYTDFDVRAFAESEAPFFIWVSHLSPHGTLVGDHFEPPKSTRTHAHVLGDAVLPSLRKPSFNVPGKGPLPYPDAPKVSVDRVQAEYTGRIRTLQDVDDALERLIGVLRDTGELENTYIFFVSDNGMMLGEHRVTSKNFMYREDIEIPLIVRVPGSTVASASVLPVTTVDLAPTIAELAGVAPGRVVDGESFAPTLRGESQTWRDTQLVQTGSSRTEGAEPGWDFRGVWTQRFSYLWRPLDGGEFLYDRESDPYEMVNRVSADSYQQVLVALRARYEALAECAGETCNRNFGPLPSIGDTSP